MANVLRILDANANRAREALRVMEDAARFLLDDATLSRDLKALRHDLSAALLAVEGLEANRDTPGDVGTTIQLDAAMARASISDVAIAAGKRLSEALRSIEEFGKTLGDRVGATGFASRIEQLRYRGYDIEHRLQRALGSGNARQWTLCLLLTESLCRPHDWKTVLTQALEVGVDCVQVREKTMDSGWLLRRACEVVDLCRGRATVIINDRPDIALLSGADGVHVGQTDLPVSEIRKLVGRQLLVGVSTHNLSHAQRAAEHGADYCGVGPMFPSTTKHKDVIAGPEYLRQFLAAHPTLPHLAIGGITPDNLPPLIEVGVRGIAVSSVICAASEPGEVAAKLIASLRANRDAAQVNPSTG